MSARLLTRRQWRGKFRQIRCAWCYHLFWPWQVRWTGANYFPHPYMKVHERCGRTAEHDLCTVAKETING